MSQDNTGASRKNEETRSSIEPLYSFEISRALLQAMALFQSEDGTRFTLCSTNFEIVESNGHYELTLVATDGRRMAIHRSEILADNLITPLPSNARFSADLDGVAKLPKVKGEKGNILTCSVFLKHVEITCDKYKYKAAFVTDSAGAANGLSVFPEWRGVIPTGTPVAVSHWTVSFDLLASFGAAAKLLSKQGTGILVRSYGENGALSVQLTQCKEFFGVLMPIRVEGGASDGQQDWVKAAAAMASKISKADLKEANT